MSLTLTDFKIIRPKVEASQEGILQWIGRAHTEAEGYSRGSEFHTALTERLLKLGAGPDKIAQRGVSVADCAHDAWDEMEIYNLKHHPRGFSMKERTILFDKIVSQVFEQFYPEEAALPDHLIHATCTGYAAPSGAQKVISKRNGCTTVTNAYHMGCYASIPAIRMAQGFGGADVVHTEISSIHMNPLLHETEQLVVQSLFGDGFIKYSVANSGYGLKIVRLREEIIPNTTDSMSWMCEDWGIKMTLSREVPVLIARALPQFLERLGTISPKAYYAIHPGGPKIIDQLAKVLKLEPWQVAHSKEILRQHGNMSSATLPHIWERMIREILEGSQVVSLAFGPGLTIAGGIFQCGS